MHFPHCKIEFVWVPGPSSISENELVDQLARTVTPSPSHFPNLSHSDIIIHLQKSHTQIWSNNYKKSINHNSDYFRLGPVLHPKPWFVDFTHFYRNSIVSICRLRFSHSRLPVNLPIMLKISPYLSLIHI